jgi:phage repressor protein C with HTH and peptisase S24 domain
MGALQERLGLESETALAAALGMKSAAYFNRKKAGSVPYAQVIELALERGVELESLFKGLEISDLTEQGARELSDGLVSAAAQDLRDAGALASMNADRFSDYELIERKGILGSAGPGAENVVVEPRGALAFRRNWLRAKGVTPRQLIVAEIVGDSMERVLFERDVVVFREQPTLTADDIYLFTLDGRLMVKRLSYRPGGGVEVIAENRDRYPPFLLTEKEALAQGFQVNGRFLWRGGDRLQ